MGERTDEFGAELFERRNDELPAAVQRMGNAQPVAADDLVAEENYVDIYRSVLPAYGAHPAEFGFDAVDGGEQPAGRKQAGYVRRTGRR